LIRYFSDQIYPNIAHEKNFIINTLFVLTSLYLLCGQSNTGVVGKVIDAKKHKWMQSVHIDSKHKFDATDSDGFTLTKLKLEING
jgi:hypothetical protein